MQVCEKIKGFFSPGTARETEERSQLDYEILFLQVVGIAAVVLGHYKGIDTALNTVFSYYSWHMPLFMFVSGMLFARKAGNRSFVQTVVRKARSLLIPAFAVNFCYGLISLLMKGNGLVRFGNPISIRTLLIDPFIRCYQFGNDISLWFIFQLFIIEMMFNVLSRIPGRKTDMAVCAAMLCVSLFSVCYTLKYGYRRSSILLLLLRTGFLAFFFSLGVTFERHWRERLKKVKRPVLWLLTVFLVHWILLCSLGINTYYNTRVMEFDHYTVNGFFLPHLFACLAILFFLLCAKCLDTHLANSRLLRYIGTNLKSVVYHHQFVGMLLNCTAVLLSGIGLGLMVPAFRMESFQNRYWYAFAWGNDAAGRLIYFILPFFLPIIYSRLMKRIRKDNLRILARLAVFLLVLAYIWLVAAVYHRGLS